MVRVGGVDAGRLSDREVSRLRARQIGLVFQQFLLAEHATVRENVADGLLYADGVSRHLPGGRAPSGPGARLLHSPPGALRLSIRGVLQCATCDSRRRMGARYRICLKATAMVLDLHPIGSSRAPSLCLCTGRNASGPKWRFRGSSPSEHLVGTALGRPLS